MVIKVLIRWLWRHQQILASMKICHNFWYYAWEFRNIETYTLSFFKSSWLLINNMDHVSCVGEYFRVWKLLRGCAIHTRSIYEKKEMWVRKMGTIWTIHTYKYLAPIPLLVNLPLWLYVWPERLLEVERFHTWHENHLVAIKMIQSLDPISRVSV